MMRGAYTEFMRTYVELPLMEENKEMNTKSYYLPHHAVVKKMDPEGKSIDSV